MHSNSAKQQLTGDALLLLVTLLAASGWIFSREAVAGLSPLLFMALRFSGAGLLLALIGFRALRRLDKAQWKTALQVGALFGTAMVFWILGLKYSSHIGIGAFLTSLGLVLVPLIAVFLGERPDRYVYASIPLALFGLACLSISDEFALDWASGCFLLAALFIGLLFILNGRAATHIPALPLTAIQLMVTGLVTGLVSLIFEDWQFQQPAAIWGWFAASMLIATSLRFLIQTRAQSMASPSHSAIIMTLEPIWTATLAALWFGESMTDIQLMGCGFIFLAMLVNRWPALRRLLPRRRPLA